MILVVTPENAHLYQRELEDAYRLRHKIFVEERGWKSWEKPDGLDRDRFDPDDSVSFLALHHGHVVGNARMVPNGGLNAELATDLKRKVLAERSPYWGLGRFGVAREIRGGTKVKNFGSYLIVAVLEYARDNGIKEMFFETDPWFIALLRMLKIRVDTIGEPMPYFGREMLMGAVPVTEHAIKMCKRMLKLDQTFLGAQLGGPDASLRR